MREPARDGHTALAEHPAARAWRELDARNRLPTHIEAVQKRGTAEVYRLHGAGVAMSAVIAKRCMWGQGPLERAIYDHVLPALELVGLRCFGLVPDPGSDDQWLFLEDAGECAYDPAEAAHRHLAETWLGALHARGADAPLAVPLPDRGPGHYLAHLQSARAAIAASDGQAGLSARDRATLRGLVRSLDILEAHWPLLAEMSAALPTTLVHGDFVGKNLRVGSRADAPALLVIDWESAGMGSPAPDIALLVEQCGDPCPPLYFSLLTARWPQLGADDLSKLEQIGQIFRLVAAVDWAGPDLVWGSVRPALRAALREYDHRLRERVRIMGWAR